MKLQPLVTIILNGAAAASAHSHDRSLAYSEENPAYTYTVETGASSSSSSNPFGSDDTYDMGESLFDMSAYSLKVHSCSSITGINPDGFGNDSRDGSGDGEDDDDGNEWANKTTAVINYRLCPTYTCHDNSWQGCRNVYGNYMIPVKQFLESKRGKEDRNGQSEELCDKCDWCSWAYSQFGYRCDIYYECLSVTCDDEDEESGDGDGDGDEEREGREGMEYSEFAECTAVDLYEGSDRRLDEQDANLVYLQIYCDGGSTLKLGVYSDEDCSNFIGDQYDISEFSELNVTESYLEHELTSDCVSCAESDSKYYFPEWEENNNKDGDGNRKYDEAASETCKKVYEESLKCNEYLPYNETAYYGYEEAEEWEESTNNVTCAFLEATQRESEGTVVSSNSYKLNFYSAMTSSTQSVTGGRFYAAGAALITVGAAFVVVKERERKSKTIGDKNLLDDFVYTGEEVTA